MESLRKAKKCPWDLKKNRRWRVHESRDLISVTVGPQRPAILSSIPDFFLSSWIRILPNSSAGCCFFVFHFSETRYHFFPQNCWFSHYRKQQLVISWISIVTSLPVNYWEINCVKKSIVGRLTPNFFSQPPSWIQLQAFRAWLRVRLGVPTTLTSDENEGSPVVTIVVPIPFYGLMTWMIWG